MKTSSNLIVQYCQEVKLIIVGDWGIGKSSIINRFVKGKFDQSKPPTYGPDYYFKQVKINEMQYKVNIYDTASLEKYQSTNRKYYKGTDAVLLAFSLQKWYEYYQQNQKQFPIQKSLRLWLSEVQNQNQKKFQIVFLANKKDLLSQFDDSENFINDLEIALQKISKQFNTKHYFTSAKTGQNIQQAFMFLMQKLYESKQPKLMPQSIILDQDNTVKKSFFQKICEKLRF